VSRGLTSHSTLYTGSITGNITQVTPEHKQTAPDRRAYSAPQTPWLDLGRVWRGEGISLGKKDGGKIEKGKSVRNGGKGKKRGKKRVCTSKNKAKLTFLQTDNS